MELLEGIETRRSSRAFQSTPVPKEVIERILEVAEKALSTHGGRISNVRRRYADFS